jgi:hypothetical protein
MQLTQHGAKLIALGSGDKGGEAFITDRVEVGVVFAHALQMVFCPLIAQFA